ncbi:MAG: cyclic nucleotide-binding domain-containing protein [Polyangiaceae bacterium]
MERARVSLDVLGATELFAGLGARDREALAACLTAHVYAPGESVFREGDPGSTLFIVASGQLVASTRRSDGSVQILNEMSAGEVVGEMAFLDSAPRSATVTAVESTTAYELTSDTMDVLRREAPAVVAAIVTGAIRDVTRRLRKLDERIAVELENVANAQSVRDPSQGKRERTR